MASTVIKNWDNNTWLSSNKYINLFNKYLLEQISLNSNSEILDIGCGRGKIIGNLSSILRLNNKPTGIDLVNHRDKDKRISFKKKDAFSFFIKNRKKFDLIMIKQTIHLFHLNKIKSLIDNCKKILNTNGKILVFMMDPDNIQIPSFKLMNRRLNISFKKDKTISKMLIKIYSGKVLKSFVYNVKITKKKYIKMIRDRFISILLPMNLKDISKGVEEIEASFNERINFNDYLNCIIITK